MCVICTRRGAGIELGSAPAAVAATVVELHGKTTGLVCLQCLSEIGERRGFGLKKREYECASNNFCCQRQNAKGRRGQRKKCVALKKIPAGKDGGLILGVPHYAPERCICQWCHQQVHHEARKLQTDNMEPVKPPVPAESHSSSRHNVTPHEVASTFFSTVSTSSSALRIPVLSCLIQLGFSDAHILGVFEASAHHKIRSALWRLRQPVTADSLSSAKSQRDLLHTAIQQYWEDAAEPCMTRRVVKVRRDDGEKQRVFVCRITVSYSELWCRFVEAHEKVSLRTFMRLKPRYVQSKIKRIMCVCRWHLQAQLFLQPLQWLCSLHSACSSCQPSDCPKTLSVLCARVTCEPKRYACCFGLCSRCPKITDLICPQTPPETMFQYRLLKAIESDGLKKLSPVLFSSKLSDFQKILKFQIRSFLQHNFVLHQSTVARKDVERHLPDGQGLVFIDFSAKYVHESPIQLQADQYQKVKTSILVILLGTRVEGPTESCLKYTTYYYVGPNSSQDCALVVKALTHFFSLEEISTLSRYHFFSDGGNHFKTKMLTAFLSSSLCPDIIWNFFPTGHGKGLWDSEGFQLKSLVNRARQKISTIEDANFLGNAKAIFDWAVMNECENIQPQRNLVSSSVVKRKIFYLPSIEEVEVDEEGVAIRGLRTHFFSFCSKSCEGGFGYRIAPCYCGQCMQGDYAGCAVAGAGPFCADHPAPGVLTQQVCSSCGGLHSAQKCKVADNASEDADGTSEESEECDESATSEEEGGRRCGVCREPGHNSRTCPELLSDAEESEELEDSSDSSNSSESEEKASPRKKRKIAVTCPLCHETHTLKGKPLSDPDTMTAHRRRCKGGHK